MANKLIVNIKRQGKYVRNIKVLDNTSLDANYLYKHAIDCIQKYFNVWLKTFEIRKGKDCTPTHLYWKVSPTGKSEYATIVIDIQ